MQQAGQFMQRFGGVKNGHSLTIRMQHGVLRVVSLLFSLASAHAILWFFSPLDSVDLLQPVITAALACGFGILGYFVSRGLAYRMMNKERFWSYAMIVLLVEFVEIFCNLSEALATIHRSDWMGGYSATVQTFLTVLTCIVWSCVPLISIGLAVVDMDLEREKRGMIAAPKNAPLMPGFGGQGGAPRPSFPAGPQPSATYPQAPARPGYGPAVNGAGAGPFAGVRP